MPIHGNAEVKVRVNRRFPYPDLRMKEGIWGKATDQTNIPPFPWSVVQVQPSSPLSSSRDSLSIFIPPSPKVELRVIIKKQKEFPTSHMQSSVMSIRSDKSHWMHRWGMVLAPR